MSCHLLVGALGIWIIRLCMGGDPGTRHLKATRLEGFFLETCCYCSLLNVEFNFSIGKNY